MQQLRILAILFFASPLSAQLPAIKPGGVVNGATFSSTGPLAPGLVFSVFGAGAGLTDGTHSSAGGTLPTRLAGARLLVNGIAAPLFSAAPDQINAQFPVELTGLASATLQVEVTSAAGTVTSPSVTVPVAPFAPGIFTQDQNGRGPGNILRAGDMSKICPPGRFDCLANPAIPGEAVLIYSTGLGAVNGPWVSGQPAQSASPTLTTPQVTIGGLTAQVVSSTLVARAVGLYAVNVIVPADAPMGDDVPLSLSIGGIESNLVTIAIGTTVSRQGGGPPGAGITSLVLDPLNHLNLYVGTAGGVFKSTNAGQSWSAANQGLAGLSVRLLTIDPLQSETLYAVTFSGLYKSTNGGGSWSATAVPLVNSFGRNLFPGILSMAIDPRHNLYAGTSLGIFKSTDGGASWNAPGNGPFGVGISAIVIDPGNPAILYAGSGINVGTGVFKSTDSGANWTPTNQGLTFTDITGVTFTPAVLALAISPDGLYAGTNEGFFKSTDGGANWMPINTGVTTVVNGQAFLSSVSSLAVDPLNPNTVYAGIIGGITKTTDGGASWNSASNGLPSNSIAALVVDPTDSATVFAGGPAGVFKSTDRAASWKISNRGITGASVRALAVSESSPATVYAATDGFGIFRSADGGATWIATLGGIPGPVSSIVIHPSNPALVYAGADGPGGGGGGGGVFESVDGGATWTRMSNGLGIMMAGVRKLVMDPSNAAELYVVTGGGFYISADGAASWTGVKGVSSVGALAVDPAGIVYAGTYAGALYKSSDRGASWTQIGKGLAGSGGTGIRAIVIDPANPSTLYLSTGLAGGVIKSLDGGESWTPANSGLPAAIVLTLAVDLDHTDHLYGATGAGVFKSTDGGATWIGAGSGLPYSINALVVGAASTVYVGTQGSGVFKSVDGGATWQPTGATQE